MSVIPFYLLAGPAFGPGGIALVSAPDGFVDIAAETGVLLFLLTLGAPATSPPVGMPRAARSAPGRLVAGRLRVGAPRESSNVIAGLAVMAGPARSG
jgi:hypothetical protein